jgi:cytidylate kinase
VSPLIAANDAVVIDSTNMSLDEVIERAEEIVKKAIESIEVKTT